MSRKSTDVLVFTAGSYTTASSKYRAFLLGRYLTEERGDIAWTIAEPSTKDISSMNYVAQIRAALVQARLLLWRPRHDVVFIQRAIYNKFIFAVLLLQNILCIRESIFDFDDAIFRHSDFKTRMLCKTSSAVIAGSHHLYEYAKQYNATVTLIPTCIKFSDYAEIRRTSHENLPTIGWLGGGSAYMPELRFLADVFRILVERGVQFRFLLIGAKGAPEIREFFGFLPPHNTEIIDYVDAKTDADLVPCFSQMDIGCMPLRDNEWNKGKCSFKAIQYMASAAAVVASPVGENTTLIQHGQTGLLATSTDEWVTCLQELVESPALRQQLGATAQEHIRKHYSFESQLPKVAALIDSLVR